MNALVRLPAGITATQSYTWVLRETFVAILQPLFPNYTIRRNNPETIQTWQLPIIGVYIAPEKLTPDGDWDAGCIKFIHDFQLAFSIIVANNDSDQAEQILDAAWWTLMNGLWPNVALMNMVTVPTADNTRIEGVMLGARRHVFGMIGETPVAELQFDVTCRYRTDWPPIITTTLDEIVVTVVPVGIDPTQTQVITVEYDFTASG